MVTREYPCVLAFFCAGRGGGVTLKNCSGPWRCPRIERVAGLRAFFMYGPASRMLREGKRAGKDGWKRGRKGRCDPGKAFDHEKSIAVPAPGIPPATSALPRPPSSRTPPAPPMFRVWGRISCCRRRLVLTARPRGGLRMTGQSAVGAGDPRRLGPLTASIKGLEPAPTNA